MCVYNCLLANCHYLRGISPMEAPKWKFGKSNLPTILNKIVHFTKATGFKKYEEAKKQHLDTFDAPFDVF